MRDYHINIFYSDEDEAYIADIPDLGSCSAFAESPELALKEVLIAKQLWIETATNNQRPIPEPKFKPLLYSANL